MSRSAAHDTRNVQLRSALGSVEQARAASQPTGKTIKEQCGRLGLSWQAEVIPASNGAKLHWIGNWEAPKVIYYFHGQ